MEYLQPIVTVLSLIAAILAWIAKIRWSDEFAKAKDETIRAKEAAIASKEAQIQLLEKEIENLREFNPVKLREYALSIKEQLEEYNDSLQSEVDRLNKKIAEQHKDLRDMYIHGELKEFELEQAKWAKEELNRKVRELEEEIRAIKLASQSANTTSVLIGNLSPLFLQSIGRVNREFDVSLDSIEFGRLLKDTKDVDIDTDSDPDEQEGK